MPFHCAFHQQPDAFAKHSPLRRTIPISFFVFFASQIFVFRRSFAKRVGIHANVQARVRKTAGCHKQKGQPPPPHLSPPFHAHSCPRAASSFCYFACCCPPRDCACPPTQRCWTPRGYEAVAARRAVPPIRSIDVRWLVCRHAPYQSRPPMLLIDIAALSSFCHFRPVYGDCWFS